MRREGVTESERWEELDSGIQGLLGVRGRKGQGWCPGGSAELMCEVAGCRGLWETARSRRAPQAEAWVGHLGWRRSIGSYPSIMAAGL